MVLRIIKNTCLVFILLLLFVLIATPAAAQEEPESPDISALSSPWSAYFELPVQAISFHNGVLAASFDGYGTYLRNSSGQWHHLTPATAKAVAYHNNVLFASFDGFGTFRWSSNQWQQLTPATARSLAYHNNVLYASFDGFGTWRWSNNHWLDSTKATARALAYHNNILYASFDGYGTYFWQSNQWHPITNTPAHALAYKDGILAAYFPGYGVYFYQNGSFTGVTTSVSNALAIGDINQNGKLDLLGSFPSLTTGMWYAQVDHWLAPVQDPDPGTDFKDVEDQVFQLLNQARNNANLHSLIRHSGLDAVARAKSKDMADNNYFDHHSPTYGSIRDMLIHYGISFTDPYYNENIQYIHRIPVQPVSAAEVHTEWMNSPGHRATRMAEYAVAQGYTHYGVGIYTNDGGKTYFITELFIRP